MPLPQDHWLQTAEIEVFAEFPWNKDGGIENKVQTDAMGLFQAGGGTKRWAPVRIWSLENGGLLLKSGDFLWVLDANGEITNPIPYTEKGISSPVVLADGNFLVLGGNSDQGKRLLRIETSGQIRSIDCPKDLVQLIRSGKTVMGVYQEEKSFFLVDLGSDGDRFDNPTPTPALVQPLFLDDEGRVQYLSYDPQLRARLWNTQLSSGEINSITIPKALYGCFSKPHALDLQGNAYGIFTSTLGCFGPDGHARFKMDLESLVPDGKGGWLLSKFIQNSLSVVVYHAEKGSSGIFREVRIPDTLQQKYHNPMWKIVDAAGEKISLLGRDPRTYSYHQLDVDQNTGELTEKTPPADLSQWGSFLQGGNSWVVTPSGHIILPIASPDALILARINIK